MTAVSEIASKWLCWRAWRTSEGTDIPFSRMNRKATPARFSSTMVWSSDRQSSPLGKFVGVTKSVKSTASVAGPASGKMLGRGRDVMQKERFVLDGTQRTLTCLELAMTHPRVSAMRRILVGERKEVGRGQTIVLGEGMISTRRSHRFTGAPATACQMLRRTIGKPWRSTLRKFVRPVSLKREAATHDLGGVVIPSVMVAWAFIAP